MSTEVSLNTAWQSSRSTSRGSSTLTRPRVSNLLTRSERIKRYILPSSTAVFHLQWKVFQSNHRTTCSVFPQISILSPLLAVQLLSVHPKTDFFLMKWKKKILFPSNYASLVFYQTVIENFSRI